MGCENNQLQAGKKHHTIKSLIYFLLQQTVSCFIADIQCTLVSPQIIQLIDIIQLLEYDAREKHMQSGRQLTSYFGASLHESNWKENDRPRKFRWKSCSAGLYTGYGETII